MEKLQKVQFKDYYQPQEYVANPKYTALWQKYEEERAKKRVENGLNQTTCDHNPEKLPDPTMKWIDRADTNLKERRKKELLTELMKVEKNL